jgi:RNA polymerase sigma-70 factor (ECF subfamily)
MDLETLLARARAGDREAWEQLLARLRPYVRGLFRRQVRNDADASDLTQDVQARMHRGFPHFRGEAEGQLRAWVRRITANVYCAYLARRRPPAEPLPVELPCPRGGAAGGWRADAEDMDRLMEELAELPPPYREVVEARLFEGRSCVEIAVGLGCPPGTVRLRWKRAVERLAGRLGGKR